MCHSCMTQHVSLATDLTCTHIYMVLRHKLTLQDCGQHENFQREASHFPMSMYFSQLCASLLVALPAWCTVLQGVLAMVFALTSFYWNIPFATSVQQLFLHGLALGTFVCQFIITSTGKILHVVRMLCSSDRHLPDPAQQATSTKTHITS